MSEWNARTSAGSSGDRAGPVAALLERPLLVSGMLAQHEQTGEWAMLIDSEQSESEKGIALWHETLHVLYAAAGKAHDEEAIEAMAKRLAACCPEIVALLRKG